MIARFTRSMEIIGQYFIAKRCISLFDSVEHFIYSYDEKITFTISQPRNFSKIPKLDCLFRTSNIPKFRTRWSVSSQIDV